MYKVRFKTKTILFSLLLVISFFATASFSSVLAAATLYFSPASGSYAVGSTMVVSVRLNTNGETINAVSAYINYPTDAFDFAWAGGSSIFNVWAEKTGGGGQVKMSGGLFPPGYTGGNGLVGSFGLKVKRTGSAGLSFAGGSAVVTQSGNSDILSLGGSPGATYSLVNGAPTQPPATPTSVPALTVSNLNAKVDTSSVIISWDTDRPADSYVEYGVEADKYLVNTYKDEKVTHHEVNLVGLGAHTTYYYRVKSKDAGGVEVVKSGGSFQTSQDQSVATPTEQKKNINSIYSLISPWTLGGGIFWSSLVLFIIVFILVVRHFKHGVLKNNTEPVQTDNLPPSVS